LLARMASRGRSVAPALGCKIRVSAFRSRDGGPFCACEVGVETGPPVLLWGAEGGTHREGSGGGLNLHKIRKGKGSLLIPPACGVGRELAGTNFTCVVGDRSGTYLVRSLNAPYGREIKKRKTSYKWERILPRRL